MRNIFLKLSFLSILMTLTSCIGKGGISNEISITNHDYSEVEKFQISWNEIFDIDLNQYLVYVYSKRCSHCQNIKNQIIDYALKEENMYFVEFNDDVTVTIDIKNTIGVSSVSDLSILGTPSLIEITNHEVSNNLAGEKAILDFLKIPSPD